MTTTPLTVTDVLDSLASEHGMRPHPRPTIGCPWCIGRDRLAGVRGITGGAPMREDTARYALAADDVRRCLLDALPLELSGASELVAWSWPAQYPRPARVLYDYGLATVCARCKVPVLGCTVEAVGYQLSRTHEPCGCTWTRRLVRRADGRGDLDHVARQVLRTG